MSSDSENIRDKTSVIILAAGNSSRFGQPKALLPFDDTSTFLQNILFEYFYAGVTDAVVVTNQSLKASILKEIELLPQSFKIKTVINPHPDKGRFTSIKLGAAILEHDSRVFIQNIDNPFVTADLLQAMMKKWGWGNYVVPAYEGTHGHPVLLSNKILQRILRTQADDIDFRKVLARFPAVTLDMDDPNTLANINTPEDYLKYFHHVAAD